MKDTNQLPPSDQTGTQALWPQMIKALAEIDRALGLPDDGCNSLAQTLEAIRALQARARVQVQVRGSMTEGTARQFVEWMKAQPDDRVPTTIDGALAEFEAHHRFTAQADLWCIHIPGPDEVYAAPSKEAADHMAAKHNAAVATYYASGALNLEFAPSIENVQAAVVKWPYDKSSHYDELSAFDWAAWGITAQAKKETT